jgi:hypothetical protein
MMKRLLMFVTAVTAVMAVLVSGAGGASASARPASSSMARDVVDRAIAAPFADVGIEPIDAALEFWQARVAERPEDYLSRTRLATTILAQARETGDLDLYPQAETVLREALAVNPTDEGALLALSSARAANHDFAGSMAIAHDVLSRNPTSQAASAVVADDDFELGNYGRATRELDALAPRCAGAAPSRVDAPRSRRFAMTTTRPCGTRRTRSSVLPTSICGRRKPRSTDSSSRTSSTRRVTCIVRSTRSMPD